MMELAVEFVAAAERHRTFADNAQAFVEVASLLSGQGADHRRQPIVAQGVMPVFVLPRFEWR
jgi:hypothetical protein